MICNKKICTFAENIKNRVIMAGINRVILIGHLGKDPEVRTIESGAKVARFPLATTEVYKDRNGERKEVTEWHNIICWRNWADVAEKYLTKGKLIYLEGKLRSRSWEDNGVKKYMTEIHVDLFTMLGARTEGGTMPVENKSNDNSNTVTQVEPDKEEGNLPPFLTEEDELPF